MRRWLRRRTSAPSAREVAASALVSLVALALVLALGAGIARGLGVGIIGDGLGVVLAGTWWRRPSARARST